MGCVDLYRATGDTRYLELAGVFVDMRGSQEGGSDVNQSYMPLRKETTAVGHAVTFRVPLQRGRRCAGGTLRSGPAGRADPDLA